MTFSFIEHLSRLYADLHITYGLISRRYDQGLDSIIRLVSELEARIEDLTALHVSQPQQLIRTQAAEIKRLQQTIDNKDIALIEAHQINRQLQQKIAGCFRTTEGVRTFCRVRSYLSSARKQSRNLLTALERALNGKPLTLTKQMT